MKLITGIYRHYKGNYYIVHGIGTHSESGEELVSYSPINDLSILWFRPYSMFIGTINDKNEPRFELILEINKANLDYKKIIEQL